jgi:hypothetical protein
MAISSRYQSGSGGLIYLPTIEACDFFKVPRLPKGYSSNSPSPASYQVGADGPQFSTFGSSAYIDSLKNLKVPPVNTRDVILEVLSNSPYTIKTETKNGITTSVYEYGGANITPLYRLSIAPTNPDGSPFNLELSHEHNWGTQSDIFSSILRGAAQIIGGADDFIQKIKNVGAATGNMSDGFKQLPNRRFDLAETYSSTTKQTIDIPFSLFTPGGEGQSGQENFLRDILDPITLITSFSYPKRSNQLGQGALSGSIDNFIKENPLNGQDNAQDLINSLNPGFRVFVSDPPSYVNIYHQGGLFSYKNCYIQKFSYTFRNFVDGSGSQIKDIETNPGDGLAGILKSISTNANLAYPVIADCHLVVTATEPLFSDDFIALSNNRASGNITTDGSRTSTTVIPANTNTSDHPDNSFTNQ